MTPETLGHRGVPQLRFGISEKVSACPNSRRTRGRYPVNGDFTAVFGWQATLSRRHEATYNEYRFPSHFRNGSEIVFPDLSLCNVQFVLEPSNGRDQQSTAVRSRFSCGRSRKAGLIGSSKLQATGTIQASCPTHVISPFHSVEGASL